MIRIATDSCNDLTKEQIQENNIAVMPLSVILGDKEYFDGENILPKDIFDYVAETGILPKTAARSMEDYKAFFEDLTKNGDEVIFVGISSFLSACYRNILEAKKQLKNNNVYVVDSLSLSTGIGLQVLYASSLVKQGLKAGEIYYKLIDQSKHVQASFIVDKLDYLYKGGRCSAMARFGANILKIKPRLELVDGKIENTAKYLGNLKVVLKKYVDDMLRLHPDYVDDICFITHTCPDDNLPQEIADYVKSKNIFKEVVITRAGATITSHCGPNTLGILYKTKVQ